jgi:hypothetical protein
MIFSAYEIYCDPHCHLKNVTRVGSSQLQDKNKTSMVERFKKAFSHKDVTVHFVGAWYVMLNLLFCTPYVDDGISGILFRLLELRVARACSLGQSVE